MTGAIETVGLTKHYGDVVGIADLDLQVHRGEVVGLLGPNGAGKSTTLRCLVGLLTPQSGSVRVLGLDPRTQRTEMAPRVGYLPGELRLYPELTGAQHLDLLGPRLGLPDGRRAELCARLDLRPEQLARSVSTYSSGMKQKIGLVQAFQHNPELLILDEPTEGLDPLVQETFFDLLDQTRAAGRTVLLSSHILSEVQRACSRVAIVRENRLVAVEAIADLRGARARKVAITLSEGTADAARLVEDLPAEWAPALDGLRLTLLVPKDALIDGLRRLLQLPVADIAVSPADLDEVFLAFYRGDDA